MRPSRPARPEPDARWWRIGVPVLAAMVLVAALTIVLIVRNDNPTNATLIRMRVAGDRVLDDMRLHERLSGDLDVADDAVWGALCNNAAEWQANISLDPTLVVSTRVDLIRAAELLASGLYEADDIERIERRVAEADPTPQELQSWVNEWGDAAARRYAVERFEPPSAEAIGRFVAYATSRSTSEQYWVVVDRDRIDPNRLGSNAGVTPVRVAGEPVERLLDASLCGGARSTD